MWWPTGQRCHSRTLALATSDRRRPTGPAPAGKSPIRSAQRNPRDRGAGPGTSESRSESGRGASRAMAMLQ